MHNVYTDEPRHDDTPPPRKHPAMKKTVLCVALLAVSLGMNGDCDFTGLPDSRCGTAAVPSVIVDIQNETGTTLDYAEASFQVDDGGYYQGACDGNCDEFTLAANMVGDFDVYVRAPGYVTQSQSVTVEIDDDECWPITENLTFKLAPDTTVAALAGAWRTTNVWGTSDIRFSDTGRVIGAILYDRVAGGDGNIYVAYNGWQIAGAIGQGITTAAATDPTRVGNFFTFSTTTLSYPIGFENAAMTADFSQLFGTLQSVGVGYVRLNEMPAALQDP